MLQRLIRDFHLAFAPWLPHGYHFIPGREVARQRLARCMAEGWRMGLIPRNLRAATPLVAKDLLEHNSLGRLQFVFI
jgi:hypothetical protein